MKAVCAGTALVSAVSVFAQSATAPLTFEVASVKPGGKDCGAVPCGFMLIRQAGGGLRVSSLSLKALIAFAYDVRDFQIPGGPAWIHTDLWDISAKVDEAEPADLTQLTGEQRKTAVERQRGRLRNLLADRFQLVIRRETREQQVYALVVAKAGPNLLESQEGKGAMRMGRGVLSAQGVELGMPASTLPQQLGGAVIDKTGLTGKYDIDLKWMPDPGQAPAVLIPRPPSAPRPPAAGLSGPSLCTALIEQLSLRLESERGSADMLIIDRVEKPSEN